MARIFLSPPDVGDSERASLLEAFDSNWIAPLGPDVDAFESEFAKIVDLPYAVALSSGTAALHLALIILGIGPGDRVIVPTLTFAATANAVRYVGAEPVFVDADPSTWNLDASLLEEALNAGPKTAALIAVDLYGQCCAYDRITAICERFGVPIIEDSAEALGATHAGRSAGSFGAISAFSFNGNKIVTTGGGGMFVTKHKPWADRARFLATQARDPAPHYQHSEIGYNYRLSNLAAALGRPQLRSLPARVARRRAIFERYRRELGHLPGWSFQPEEPQGRSTRWLTCVQIDPREYGATREDVRRHLETLDIESRPVWKPMHLQPVFSTYSCWGGLVAAGLFETGLCLPSGSGLTDEQQERVIAGIFSVQRGGRSS